MVQKRYVDMQTIQDMCNTVYQQAVTDQFQPDLLIGLSRGGLVPLGYLSNEAMFNIRTVKTIGIKSYDDHGKQSALQCVIPISDTELACLSQYRSILIIDDLVDSGKTLSFVVGLIKQHAPHATIKTATLFCKPTTRFKPDFYAQETTDWLVFPWENCS